MPDSGWLWRLLDRLTAFLPGPPDGKPSTTVLPDPQQEGLTETERVSRWRLWRQRLEKAGRGGYR